MKRLSADKIKKGRELLAKLSLHLQGNKALSFNDRVRIKYKVTSSRLSYDQVTRWRTDFDKLVAIMLGVNFKTVAEAVKSHKEIVVLWKRYLKNLKEHLSRDYYAVVDYYKDIKDDSAIKDRRARLASLFDAFEDACIDWYSYADPYRYSADPNINPHATGVPKDVEDRMDYYVNESFKSGQYKDKADKAGDKLWSAMREYIKTYSGDKKEFEHSLEAPSKIEYMGITFVNDLYYTDYTLQEKLSTAAPWLRKLKQLMPEVFYGKVHLLKKTYQAKNAVKKGDSYSDAAGFYQIQRDEIEMFSDTLKGETSNRFTTTLIHELAHRYYYKFMDASGRQRWEHFFNEIKVDSASEYGKTNPSEDFAEAVLHYVYGKGYMEKKDVRDRLEAILNGRRISGSQGWIGYYKSFNALAKIEENKSRIDAWLVFDAKKMISMTELGASGKVLEP